MKLVLVDDHPLVWEGIKAVLETEEDIELVGWANSGKEAERLFENTNPDVALMDLRLPGECGINIINRLRPLFLNCRFIVLTTSADPQDIKQAMDAQVDGYILKEALPQEMITALRLVNKGRPYYDPSVMHFIINKADKNDEILSGLTDREVQVLNALSQGLNNKEIANKLFVSEHTVKKHISNILSKLGLKDRTKAAIYAATSGLFIPSNGLNISM